MNISDLFQVEGLKEAERQKMLQQRMEALKNNTPKSKDNGPMQAGAREYPSPPLSDKQLEKPGGETDLVQKPMYDAPYYKGSGKLNGMTALITGGDSGIGRSVAILFAREGANVALVYLSEEEDARKTAQMVLKEGRECLLIPGSVSDKKFCRYAVEEVIRVFGGLSILVNNAAFQLHCANIEQLSDEQFDATLHSNLYGYFYMAQAAIPHMPYGSAIINTGSVTGISGSKNLLDYSLTKGGLHAFTRSLSGHLIDKGIRVNAVAPGPVWTPLNPADQEKEAIRNFGANTPMKRPAQPEEIAPAYVFLASPQCSSYVTGEVIPIIGGY